MNLHVEVLNLKQRVQELAEIVARLAAASAKNAEHTLQLAEESRGVEPRKVDKRTREWREANKGQRDPEPVGLSDGPN